MSTWRMVRGSTPVFSRGQAPAEVRPGSVSEGATGVALDAGLVRLQHAAVGPPARAQDLQARMSVTAREAGGRGRSRPAPPQLRHRRLQGRDAGGKVVGRPL